MFLIAHSAVKRRVLSAHTAWIRHASITALFGFLTAFITAFPLQAQQPGILHGEVRDPLGALVSSADVVLLHDGHVVETTKTSAQGSFQFEISNPGRYGVRVNTTSFQTTESNIVYIGKSAKMEINVSLSTPISADQITVTATGTPKPEAQVGASVTILQAEDFRYSPEVQDPLRLVPGVQITQTGQTGGTSGLSIRGANTDTSKVLIDGIPANSIGGAVEFANLASVAVQSIEVLREPNSALYGSDALAGVVSLTSPRGTTRLPLLTYAGDAGNFGTYRNEVTAGTTYRQFDLYSAFARFDTDNSLPNSEFHNATYAGNFGWTPDTANDLRFTVRHFAISGGQPNAIALYGIPDDGQQKEQDDYYGVTWNNHPTDRWHNLLRYGGVRQHNEFNEFGATGIPDLITGYWDGAPVTITGANGYSVQGQAVFQFSDQSTTYLSPTNRDFVYAQTDYSLNPHLQGLGAFKFEHESGSVGYTTETPLGIQRNNYSYTLQLTGDLRNRLFWNVGTGLEDNGLFGFAATPRVSLAYYLSQPSSASFFTGTKLHGTFGKGIKEPSVYQQLNSLYGTLLAANEPQAITQYAVTPLGAEDSRTFDGGIEQQIMNGRALAGITYFHNEFTNGVEYVPQLGLVQLGIPAANLPPFAFGGAYINSLAYRSQGIEFETEYRFNSHFFARGGYTYTDAVVQRSLSSDNIGLTYNTASNFSTIPIGADSPLVGARPFRVAPHTGYFSIHYTQPRFYASLTGTLVGKRDDSDFLSDSNFGTSLLLPNRNLLGSYQRLELGAGYQLRHGINLYSNIQNLLSEHYYEAFGFPALPLTFRAGIKLSFGGESWKM